jgi:myo-inositol-1(or 4)-monophosphatase
MLNKVIDIVREASKLMYNREFNVQSKGTVSNNVTTADLAVQTFLESKLPALVEGSYFLGEENFIIAKDKPYQWIVDPIDGTANFIRDLGASVISVALIKEGKAVLGVIYNPYRDECIYAEEGKGAYLNGKPIRVSDRTLERSIFCTALSLYNKDLATPCLNILEKVYPRCDDFRRFGAAALELAYLACGRVDIYFEIRLFPWDFAAADIIIREAGGYVGTIEYKDTVFHRPIPIICANTKDNYDYLKQVVENEIPTIPYKD